MAYTFDAANKLVILSSGTVAMSVRDVYSRWKEWVQTSDNSKYLPAFTTTGGDPIDPSAGTSIPAYMFLVNGWRIRPQEADHTLNVSDGVLVVNGGGDPFVNTTGSHVVRINYSQPVQAITVSTGGGVATAEEIAAAVWANITRTLTSSGGDLAPLEAKIDRNADLIESQRGLHTWQGQMLYVGPTYGNDTTGNGSRAAPYKTITKALTAVVDGNHDLIYVLADATSGQTLLNERVTVSKSYTFIRGPGRDVLWKTTSAGDLLTINGAGVEISGFEMQTHTAGSGCVIEINAKHCQVHNVFFSYSRSCAVGVNGGGSFAWIHDNVIHGTGQSGASDAIDVDATSAPIEHCKIEDNSIAESTGDGISVKNTKAEDIIIRRNTIIGCTGYGINIQSGLRSAVFDNHLGSNALGNIVNTGTNSTVENNQQWATATAVENAAATLAAAQVTPIHSNVKQVNDVSLAGAGVTINPWRPA